MSAHLKIKMVQSGGNEFPVDVDLTATIAELKEQISAQASIPKENIRLVCAGKIWQDVATVGSYEPRDGAIVHCLNNPPKAAPAASEQTLTPVNPMQAMMGGGAPPPAAAANADPMAQMMAQSQQMMAQNPDMMAQLMDSPMVQQMMSNPETLRAMMSMNPRMQQLMEQRPEIARMLEDPETIRQSMQMMRNPSLMREMQRNQDRALGQLDVMPGGHNALVRAHGEIVDPMMAALTGGDDNGVGAIDMSAYEQQAEGAPNNAALPNPWGAPAPAPAAAQPPAMAPAFPAAQPTPSATPGANPMADMMQQMMSNPAMMQQSMQMAQQMGMGGGMGGNMAQPQMPAPTATPAPTADNPFAAMMAGGANAPQAGANANPMGAMMQQMMSNPAMMQQAMQMAQQMQMGGGMGGGMGNGFGGYPGMFDAPAMAGQPAAPLDPAVARVQFANQLAQLSAMGFSNETACLQALQQHQGRVDAAIDSLLTSGDGHA